MLFDFLGLPVPAWSYSPFTVFADLDINISKGERVALVGRNGAGKSTLLNIIGGRLKPTAGHVQANGSIQALMEIGTGFHPEFTGRQNIFASLSYSGILGKQAQALADEIIDFSELRDFIDQPVKTYSAGMYARLAFSASTAIMPDILIIDEILGAGDAYFAAKSTERMRELTVEKGATVLFVSHDLAAVQRLCTRALWLEKGKIIMDDTPLAVSKAYFDAVMQQEEASLQEKYAAKLHEQAAWNKSVQGQYFTEELTILTISPYSSVDKAERFVFSSTDTVCLRIRVEINTYLEQIDALCVVYNTQGIIVSLVHGRQRDIAPGRADFYLTFETNPLRQGEYVCSVELSKEFDEAWNGEGKMPFLAHWDRCTSFLINENHFGKLDLGLVRIPASLTYSPHL